MSSIIYPLQIQDGRAGGHTGVFSDFPSLRLEARTLPGLVGRARAALLAELERHQHEGLDWPAAADGDALKARTAAGEMLVLIEVQVDDAPVRVNITMGERLLRRLDAAVQAQDTTRSGFIAAAVRERLGDEPEDGSLLERLLNELGRVGGQVNRTVGAKSNLGRLIDEVDRKALDGLHDLVGRFTSAKSQTD